MSLSVVGVDGRKVFVHGTNAALCYEVYINTSGGRAGFCFKTYVAYTFE